MIEGFQKQPQVKVLPAVSFNIDGRLKMRVESEVGQGRAQRSTYTFPSPGRKW